MSTELCSVHVHAAYLLQFQLGKGKGKGIQSQYSWFALVFLGKEQKNPAQKLSSTPLKNAMGYSI